MTFAGFWGYVVSVGRGILYTNLPAQFFTMNNTIIALFQTINALALLIETFTIFAIHLITLAIVLGDYFIQGCRVVYTNRHEILKKTNNFRNALGYQFAYAS